MFDFFKRNTTKACFEVTEAERALLDEKLKSICVLGAEGCSTCHTLLRYVEELVSELGVTAKIEFVTDMKRIVGYGALGMPGLVLNEKLVSAGRMLTKQDLIKVFISFSEK